jgi:hypothetical protein
LDKEKTEIAIKANFVQALESAVARNVVSETLAPAVHDNFTIDYKNAPYLLSVVNVSMNIKHYYINEDFNKEDFNKEGFDKEGFDKEDFDKELKKKNYKRDDFYCFSIFIIL